MFEFALEAQLLFLFQQEHKKFFDVSLNESQPGQKKFVISKLQISMQIFNLKLEWLQLMVLFCRSDRIVFVTGMRSVTPIKSENNVTVTHLVNYE